LPIKQKIFSLFFILATAVFFTFVPVLNNAGASSNIFNYNLRPLNSLATQDLGTSAYIPTKANFIQVLELTNYQVSNFLKKLYDKQNYYVENTSSYTINQNKKTIMVSCSLNNTQGNHIQYIENAMSSGITGCPVLRSNKIIAMNKAIHVQNNRFVEVNIIHI